MQYYVSNGAEIAFSDITPASGTGDPIVLIHGFASNHTANWISTLWGKTLVEAGYRVIAADLRGHGLSEKHHSPDSYSVTHFQEDIRNLLDATSVPRADIMGYSMGSRVAAVFAVKYPERVRSLVLGGIGVNILKENINPELIAGAMEAPGLESLTDPTQIMFRSFAQRTRSDLKALAACIRGFDRILTTGDLSALTMPVLIAVGTNDSIADSALGLRNELKNARILDIPGKDHHSAVGDKVFKQGVLDFLKSRP
ncbi:MAG: alpha/beta hydrolase [Methylobacteriaceae bacterium]|jgi:pimeloyl-ACP methyl ester carboxylesterase|nr:alpha/beta hydrolase [Methylobacteriaceae bacterium]